jgi:hypothetical protein
MAPPPPAPIPELPSPFADRGRRGLVAGYLETWKLAALEPERFFRHVRIDQVGPAIGFGLGSLVVGLLFSALYGRLLQRVFMGWAGRMGGHGAAQPRIPLVEWIQGHPSSAQVMQIAFNLVLFFVAVLVIHLMLLLFRGGQRGFDATLTVAGYSCAPWLLLVLPAPGLTSLVAAIWQLVLLVIGLAAAHRTTGGKAAAAVLIPVFLGLCCVCCGAISWGMQLGLEAAQSGGTTNL